MGLAKWFLSNVSLLNYRDLKNVFSIALAENKQQTGKKVMYGAFSNRVQRCTGCGS